MKSLVIIGAGGHGAVIAEAAISSGKWSRVEFLDDNPSVRRVVGLPVRGGTEELSRYSIDETEVVVAIGDNQRRLELLGEVRQRSFYLATIFHSTAAVSPSASVGEGTVVLAGAILSARASLGRGCIVNTGATIDHDCRLEDGVHVSPGAHLAGQVSVGTCAWVGIGAAIREKISVGAYAVIGAGSAVTSGVGPNSTVGGVPARELRG